MKSKNLLLFIGPLILIWPNLIIATGVFTRPLNRVVHNFRFCRSYQRGLNFRCFSTKSAENLLCGLTPKKDQDLQRSINRAKEFLRNRIHVDVELGHDWGFCQGSASTGIKTITQNDPPPVIWISYYLLSTTDDGQGPRAKQIRDRIKELDLELNGGDISLKDAEKILKKLQTSLRKEIAHQLDVELEVNSNTGNPVPKDRKKAFLKAMKAVIESKTKIYFAYYYGTPNLTEVRSFGGCSGIVPYIYNEETNKYELDKSEKSTFICGEGSLELDSSMRPQNITNLSFIEAKNNEYSIGDDFDGKVVRKIIPKLNIPIEGEHAFIFHIGIPDLTHHKVRAPLKERKTLPGNIISAAGLEDMSPIGFAIKRFMDMSDLKEEELENEHLSLYHFSFALNWTQNKMKSHSLEIPNNVLLEQPVYPNPSLNPSHFPLIIFNQYVPMVTTLIKADRGYRYAMNASIIIGTGHLDLEDSTLVIEKQTPDGFVAVEDEKIYVEKAKYFFNLLLFYHNSSFCLKTRNKLNDAGLTKETIQNLLTQDLNQLGPQEGQENNYFTAKHNKYDVFILEDIPAPWGGVGKTIYANARDYQFELLIIRDEQGAIDKDRSSIKVERTLPLTEDRKTRPYNPVSKKIHLAQRVLDQLCNDFSKVEKGKINLSDVFHNTKEIKDIRDLYLEDYLIDNYVPEDILENEYPYYRPYVFTSQESPVVMFPQLEEGINASIIMAYNSSGRMSLKKSTINAVISNPENKLTNKIIIKLLKKKLLRFFEDDLCPRTRKGLEKIGLNKETIEKLDSSMIMNLIPSESY